MRFFVLILLFSLFVQPAFSQDNPYPLTPKERVVERLHGVRIVDNYRWMENLSDPRLDEWIEAQNEYTDGLLKDALYSEIYAELAQATFSRQPTESEELTQNTRLDYLKPVSQDQFNSLNKDESNPYKVIIQKTSKRDLAIIKFQKKSDSTYLQETLLAKHFSMAWAEDYSFFVYSLDNEGRVMGSARPLIKKHIIGTDFDDDILVYRSQRADSHTYFNQLEDGRIFAYRNLGSQGGLFAFDINSLEFTSILPMQAGMFEDIKITENFYYAISYRDHDHGEVIEVNLASKQIRTIAPADSKFALKHAFVADNEVITVLNNNMLPELVMHNLHTRAVRRIDLGKGEGVVRINKSATGDIEILHTSILGEETKYSYQELGESFPVIDGKASANTDIKVVKVMYESYDGQMRPVFLFMQKDTQLSPQTAVHLYGYGGFRSDINPAFRSNMRPFIARGGAYARVTLPGGMEYGEKWHRDGALLSKKNTFDELARIGRTLIQRGLTHQSKLSISGRSNGGLLVGATMNLYPDLFIAGVPGVGVLDMTRYQLYTSGKWWVKEYGDRNDSSEFRNLFAISPYHNLKRRRYPHTLVFTGALDDRVVPSHSYKYMAKMQEYQSHDRDAFIKVFPKGSHASSGSVELDYEREALIWAFIISRSNMLD